MPFEKGASGNNAGRPTGTPNKATKPLRETITDFVSNNWQQVENDFKVLEPKDRLLFFEKLLKYSLPTLQAINVTSDLEKQLEGLSDEQLETLMNKILENYNH
jgi:hypothetical protein